MLRQFASPFSGRDNKKTKRAPIQLHAPIPGPIPVHASTTASSGAEADDSWEYEDQYARMSYEIAASVRELERSIPPDTDDEVGLAPVVFHPSDRARGAAVLLFAGDFMLTEGQSHLVQPRTLRMLDELHVRYSVTVGDH